MKWKSIILASAFLAVGGCGSGLLWIYSEQLDDEHEALVADSVEIVVKGPNGSLTTRKVPRKFLPANPVLASEIAMYGEEKLAKIPVGEGAILRTTDLDPRPPANPETSTATDRFSTFAIDVDTASYGRARKVLQGGFLPTAREVRVEEFVNYFDYAYAPPEDQPFAVYFDGAPSPFDTTGAKQLLRIGVQGKRIDAVDRAPVHLTLLVDVSGSMRQPGKLDLARRALKELVQNLQPEDTVAMATYAGDTQKILPPTSAKDSHVINGAIHRLAAGGGTAMSSGLETAYEMAMESHVAGHESRVVVLGDGDANLGPTSHQEMLDSIRHYVNEGVTMSTISFGTTAYNDATMEELSNAGNGNSYFVGDMRDARKVFGEDLTGTMVTIAKDVKVQVEFDPAKVSTYRLIGYENRDVADRDFRNDDVDAGELGAGHTVTALYEVKLMPEATGELATVRIRHKEPDGFESRELAYALDRDDFADKLQNAHEDLRFAAGVAVFAELLRESPHASHFTFAAVREVIGTALNEDAERIEFYELVDKAASARRGYNGIEILVGDARR